MPADYVPADYTPADYVPADYTPADHVPAGHVPADYVSEADRSAEDLLTSLDPEQRQVAEALRGPVVVLAGAGTGKTRAITHRIAYGVATGVYKPTEVLAVTFTVKAAGEMRQRLAALGAHGVQARTFHSAALRQVRYFWPRAYGRDVPEIVKSKIPLLRESATRLGMSAPADLIRDIASEIEWAKVSNVRPADYARLADQEHRQVADLPADQVGDVYETYEVVKRESDRMDMEDILLANAAILDEHERIAAQVRSQYRWFVVDEYQDVNPLQAALLDLWLGGRDELCVVGDPRQTIYSFAGATQEYLTTFGRRYQQAQRIELVRNYRSSPQIVAAANAVFRDSRAPGVQLRSQSPAADPVSYTGYDDEAAEAEDVATRVLALHRSGIAYRDIAILYRINAQSQAYQEALGAKRIPFTVRGDVRFFDRPEVRQAVTLLRGSARAGSNDAGVGSDVAADVRSLLASMGYTDEPPQGAGTVRDRWESLHTLVTMASDLPEGGTIADLVAELDRRAATAHAPTMDGVTLATLHSAKGLEWDAVFCIGMHEGTMPLIYATEASALEEERRLFYVGITRARSKLSISWAAAREAQSKRRDREPTRYLDPLLPSNHPARRSRASAARHRKTRRCPACQQPLAPADRAQGHCAGCTVDFDPQLFEELRAWRTSQGETENVPAFVVFTDATLRAIAAAKPSSLEALATIHGVGRTKLDRYGAQVLELVNG